MIVVSLSLQKEECSTPQAFKIFQTKISISLPPFNLKPTLGLIENVALKLFIKKTFILPLLLSMYRGRLSLGKGTIWQVKYITSFQ